MTVRLQVVMSDEMAEGVRRAAESEDRSVSQWLRLLIEAELAREPALQERVDAPAKVNPKAAKLLAEPSAVERKRQRPVLAPKGDCPHPDLGEKRPTSFGFARDCKVCGEVVKV